MVYYDSDSRLQIAREHAERLAEDMRRTRRLDADEPGNLRWASLLYALARRLEGKLRRRGHRAPVYGA
jgi:hypothetical protein